MNDTGYQSVGYPQPGTHKRVCSLVWPETKGVGISYIETNQNLTAQTF